MQRTKLQRVMADHDISDVALAAESGVSVRHIIYIRQGQKEPTRVRMAAILAACQKLVGKPLAITDIFDFSMRSARGKKAA